MSPFPRISSDALPLIAPLWADYNFRKAGNVYYRITRDNATLERARELITEISSLHSKFSPSECVIVTWVNAELLTRILDNTRVCFTGDCRQQKSEKGKAYYLPCLDKSCTPITSIKSDHWTTSSGPLAIFVAYIMQSPVAM